MSNTISVLKIKKVNSIITRYINRPKNNKGEPGGLIELATKKKPIIVGDLHSNLHNLQMILNHEDNLQSLKNRKSILIFLGDAIHNDQTGQIKEMQSSLEIIEYIFELFLEFNNDVIYIKGNHDTFDDRLVKNAIPQGLEFKNYLLKYRGEPYVKEVEKFFDNLPLFILSNNFVITHAGPVRGGITREEIINIKFYKDKYQQLLWNRINEFRGTPSLKEYDEYDIKKTLEKLGLPLDTPFIVGHNPLWNTGNRTGVWLDAIGIDNHHIMYSGSNTRAPYFTMNGIHLIVKYAIKPKQEVLYG